MDHGSAVMGHGSGECAVRRLFDSTSASASASASAGGRAGGRAGTGTCAPSSGGQSSVSPDRELCARHTDGSQRQLDALGCGAGAF